MFLHQDLETARQNTVTTCAFVVPFDEKPRHIDSLVFEASRHVGNLPPALASITALGLAYKIPLGPRS
jgi:hypothetical protein